MKLLSFTIDGPDGSPIPIQGVNGQPTGGLDKLASILGTALELLLIFAIVFSLLMLIYAGYQWMSSAGDKQKLASARQRLTFVLVGIVFVFLSFLIITVLGDFFKINLLDLPKSLP